MGQVVDNDKLICKLLIVLQRLSSQDEAMLGVPQLRCEALTKELNVPVGAILDILGLLDTLSYAHLPTDDRLDRIQRATRLSEHLVVNLVGCMQWVCLGLL